MLVKNHEVGDESVDKIEEKKQKQFFEKKLDDLKWGMFRKQDNPMTMEEPDDNKRGKLKNFMRKREIEDFEDEKQEGLERREKGEMVEALEEKMPEEAELKAEKGEEFTDGQKQLEVERLEKTKYDVSGESREEFEGDKQEEFEDREQEGVEKFEEEKHKVDGESVEGLEDKIQEDLVHEEEGIAFDEDLEEVGKLKKYEEDSESVEELEEEENLETEKMKELEEGGELEESNKSRQDDLNGILKKEEVEENRKEGASKWNFVEDSGEGTQEGLAQVEEDKKQAFNRELKVSEDMQNVGDFVDSKNVNEETVSLECMDELCTRFERDEIIKEREKFGFDHGSNLHASTLTDVLLADRTQEDPEVTLEDVEHDLIGLSFHQTDQFDEKSDVAIESGGEFDHLKKAIIPSSQKPIMKIKELTESPSGFDGKTNEISNPQPLPSPKHALDSRTNSDKDLQTNFQPPSPSLTQTSPSTYLPPNTAKPQQLNPLSKTYKTLPDHMSTQETSILTDLFGKKNLKKLDDILGHADVFTEDVDHDESVLMDIEAILHDHWEILFPPSMRLSDAPEEDKEKIGTRIAIQKLEILLKRARDIFDTTKSDINRANAQAQQSCIGASCSTSRKDKETMETVGVMVQEQNDGGPEKNQEDDSERASEKMSLEENVKMSQSQTAPPQLLEGVTVKNQDSIHRIQKRSSSQTHGMDFVKWLKMKVVSSLPYDIRPGPDLDGIPWELIIISSLVGLVTLLFSCRCYSSVKSRLYRRKEWRMADQVAQLLEEKCEVLETLSKCQQEYNELETSRSESDTLAQTHEIDLEVRAQQLDLANTQLEESLQELKDQLDQQRLHREEQEQKVTLLEQSMETIQEETKELQSQEQQAQTTIKVYDMNSERLQRNQETAGEENSLLIESNTQLSQQVEGWAERVSELEEEMRRYELAHSGMVQDVANKDERIMSLTDRLLGMKAWDADLEEDGGDSSKGATGRAERNGKVDGTKSEIHLQKVQKLIYAAKLNADLKSVDEDKDRVFAKLNDEIKAKEDLEVSIKELENEQLSMQADTERYNEQVQRLQQKLQIMTEMYQENELKLHRLLTVEEKERLQKEDKLNKADKNIALAIEELNNYKLRAGEMEEELEKTKQSYQTQISAHEKKAHNNWLAARAADRELSDIKRENALLRQKLTDTQFKLDALDREPFTLDSVARPLPFRAERLPFGPSPLGRPASENRALLSPPTLLEGPLNRLSPRGTRGPVEPPCAHGELEQTGGPHSDSGSISPSWERDRRGPPLGAPGPFPPQGCMFPEPGGPIYRRPGPPPGMIAPLPPPGPPFPLPRALPNPGPLGPIHYADTTDGTNREHSLGPEQDHQEPTPSDGRTPPLRRGTAPPSGPPIGPIDGPFPRRAPFGPPDFFPPRGPGGPPMMPMWAPRPGMMFPPLYAHGGPPPPPHPLSYGPPMRPPPPDGLPPPSVGPPVSQQNLPPVPRSQSQDELTSAP
ncbi:uncharacterized protein ctage5 isoform X1 [Hippocampus zosterae]|uniref:uncharacterized protein ctage5 isoform X1 n=1 Tax=Hippocampus zosterae TaxID=109293 RepID=UPI00223D0CA0|nr:uncharacterized protein ctage5 isoform X1 [Hippocampus zosterae]